MMNCKEATELASNRLDRELNLTERIGLKIHLFICKYCRRYSKHLGFIKQTVSKLDAYIEARQDIQLSDAAKEKIKKVIMKENL